MPDTEAKRVAIMITEGFHDAETLEPINYLNERGIETVVIGPAVEEVTAYNSDQTVQIEKAVTEVSVDEFDGLIIPGGRSPAALREVEEAVEFARKFVQSGKPVAAICHGPQVLVTAGVVEGRTLTCVGGVASEIEGAGGEYVDQAVAIDGNIITSRTPPDLPQFNQAIYSALTE